MANMREAVAAFLALTAAMAWLTARYLKLPSTIGVMAATLILSAAPSRRVAPSAPLNSQSIVDGPIRVLTSRRILAVGRGGQGSAYVQSNHSAQVRMTNRSTLGTQSTALK